MMSANQALARCEEFSNRIWISSISAGTLILYDIFTIPFSVKRYNESKLKRTGYYISYNHYDQKHHFGPKKLKFSKIALVDRTEKNTAFQTDEPDKLKQKSTLTAYMWTAGVMVTPVLSTYISALIFYRDNDQGDIVIASLLIGGTIGAAIGPSAGHWYAGQKYRATAFSVLRIGLAYYGWRSTFDYINCID